MLHLSFNALIHCESVAIVSADGRPHLINRTGYMYREPVKASADLQANKS